MRLEHIRNFAPAQGGFDTPAKIVYNHL